MSPHPRGEPAVWGRDIPKRNFHFTGRQELLSRLRESLTRSEGRPRLQVLRGGAGVGKTQLAVEYSHRYRREYDLVWWISAHDPKLVKASLAVMAEVLNLGVSGADAAVPIVLDSLRRGTPHARWLLIFDNAEAPDQVQEFIPDGAGDVLVTSRDQRWSESGPTIGITVFDRSESVAYLTRRVDGLGEHDADRLAAALGDLPIALAQAASLQTESGVSTDAYLEDLASKGPLGIPSAPPLGYPMALHNVWALSIAAIRAHNPDAVELLDRCAFFGPGPIPLSVFTETGSALDSPFAEILDDPMRFKRALGTLNRYALADVNTARNTAQVHRLMQAYRRHELAHRADEVRHEVHLLMSALAPRDPELRAGAGVYASLLPHVDESQVIYCATAKVRRFCIGLMRNLYTEGDYLSLHQYAEQAVRHWRRDVDDTEPEVLVALRHLGMGKRLLGDVRQAHELNQRTLSRLREVLGEEHMETLAAMNDYGGDLRAMGRFAEALRLDEKSYRIHAQLFGDQSVTTLRAANNLALDYRLTSAYHKALELDRQVLEHRRALYGRDDHDRVLASRNQVARDLRECGHYAESAALQREIFADYRRVLNEDHPFVLRAQKNLSVSLRKDGRLDESRALAEDVRARYLRVFHADHVDALAAAANMINELRSVGEFDAAYAIGVDTLERYRRVLGDEHPLTLGCMINVALACRLHGDPREARKLSKDATTRLRRVVGPDHHYTLTGAIALASDSAACGDPHTACEVGADTLGRWRRAPSFGPDHPYTLSCALNLAADREAADAADTTDTLRADSLRRLRAVLRQDHPLLADSAAGNRLECDFEPPPL